MHTDRKIGFALGILLVGIVAALFFRNEPLLPTDMPSVRRERELNERLRERDVAVYLNEDASSDAAGSAEGEQPWTLRDVLRNMGRRNKGQPSAVAPVRGDELDGRPPQSLDGFRSIRESDDEPTSLAPIVANGQTLTDPKNVVTEVRPLPPLLPPGPDAVPVPDPHAPDPEPVTATAIAEFTVPESFDEYVVKYGDTLSGIAQKLLGSQSRYQEIYDANRDRMSSPDQLQVGKPIRIPRLAAESGGTQRYDSTSVQ